MKSLPAMMRCDQEEADRASLEAQRLQRAVEEGEEAARRLRESRAAAKTVTEASQQVRWGMGEEGAKSGGGQWLAPEAAPPSA